MLCSFDVESVLTLHDDGMPMRLCYFVLVASNVHWQTHKSHPNIVLNNVESVVLVEFAGEFAVMDSNPILSRSNCFHCWHLHMIINTINLNTYGFIPYKWCLPSSFLSIFDRITNITKLFTAASQIGLRYSIQITNHLF